MGSYAVVETGGKQYRVQEGEEIQVERLEDDAGATVELKALAVSNGDGELTLAGSVKAEVVEHLRGKKLIAFKKKRRKTYKRKVGHRQSLTLVKITKI